MDTASGGSAAGHSLREGNRPVHQVAADFGYTDEYYFSRVFKTHMGLSPLEYRQGGR